MAICYIKQEEVYSTTDQNDRLPILNAESALSLNEDLNYIRSVIFNILGLDSTNAENKWYKVPFYNLTFLFEKFSILENDFSVEHYTSSENPTLRGKHKNVTATGNLSVDGYGSIGQSLTIGSYLNVGTTLATGSDANIGGNLNVELNGSILVDLSVGRNVQIGNNLTVNNDTSIGNDLSVGRNAIISGYGSFGGNLSVSGNSSIGGSLTVNGVTNIQNNLNVSGLTTTSNLLVNSSFISFSRTAFITN